MEKDWRVGIRCASREGDVRGLQLTAPSRIPAYMQRVLFFWRYRRLKGARCETMTWLELHMRWNHLVVSDPDSCSSGQSSNSILGDSSFDFILLSASRRRQTTPSTYLASWGLPPGKVLILSKALIDRLGSGRRDSAARRARASMIGCHERRSGASFST